MTFGDPTDRYGADDLRGHLRHFGIRRFDDDEAYTRWSEQHLGRARGIALRAVLKPMRLRRRTREQERAFYDFIADRAVAPVVHSLKADAIRVSGEFAARFIAGPRILDLGCSSGHLTTWYAITCPQASVLGLDVSAASIALARQYAEELRLGNCAFEVGDAAFYVPEQQVDQIVDTQGALDSPESGPLIARLLSWLTPGGRVICVPPTANQRFYTRFVAGVVRAGGAFRHAGYTLFNDFGMVGGYPTFVIGAAAEREGMPVSEVQAVFPALLAQVLAAEAEQLAEFERQLDAW